MGLLLGFLFLEMDENDGIRALKITFLAALFSGFIGYSDIGTVIYKSGLIQNILFLFYDFARFNELSGYSNKWDTAFQIALSLYLDIINLLLEILEAMD